MAIVSRYPNRDVCASESESWRHSRARCLGHSRSCRPLFLLLALFLFGTPTIFAQTELFWGDTHVHTSYSVDAYLLGDRNVGPEEAYRFGKGLKVAHPSSGEELRLDPPLDFMIVADHARGLGALPSIMADDPRIKGTLIANFFKKGVDEGTELQVFERLAAAVAAGDPDGSKTGERIIDPPSIAGIMQVSRSAWNESIQAADRNYEPGVFTTFIGWEWTPDPNGANLHRVVFMPEDASVAEKFMPFGSHMSERPEALWNWMDSTGKRLGARFTAIPHNPNLSKGRMFALTDTDGRPITADYAQTRSRWEPVAEVTQMKGDSETHPLLSPTDEFAGFEFYKFLRNEEPGDAENPGSFLRSALKRGLAIEQDVGVNPYKLGMIGSSDVHTGLSTTREDNFAGKFGRASLGPAKADLATHEGSRGIDFSAQGLAAVWAEENTRESIYEAFQRREVYGTTGTRIALRFFGGWEFKDEDTERRDFAEPGYAKGVPMGSDLTAGPSGTSPTFLIEAVQDPKGARLDRIQVIKGWVDGKGETQEKVFNVAMSGSRSPEAVPSEPVGSTVDLEAGTYGNSVGAPRLAVVWSDPEFDAGERAFYYVRVLEIPTPRHTLYDAVEYGLPLDPSHPATLQERAYSSPIWYVP